jgi:hypothetical protein
VAWACFIPFSRQSPLQLPNTLSGALTSPFLLLWAYTTLCDRVETTLEDAIRRITTKPDNADKISSQGLAVAKISAQREPPWTLSDELKLQSRQMKTWVGQIFRTFFDAQGEGEAESSQRPAELPVHPPAQPEEADLDRASTATPDPADLFAIDEIEQPSQPPPAPLEPQDPLSRTNTLFTPLNQSPATTPPASPRVRASLIHRDSETVTMQLELLESQREMNEELHGQGLESSEGPANGREEVVEQLSSEITAARATVAEVDTIVTEIARLIREEEDQSEQQQDETQRKNDKRPQHRVTTLSNFSSDAFASHAARLITTVIVMPLDTLLVRSLAIMFLGPSPLARNVRPCFSWAGWRYNATLLGLFGMQALVSSMIWGFGTTVAIGLGKYKYQWGRG